MSRQCTSIERVPSNSFAASTPATRATALAPSPARAGWRRCSARARPPGGVRAARNVWRDGGNSHLLADVFGGRAARVAEGDGDGGEQIEGEAEAIEAGAEVGAGRGTRTVMAVAMAAQGSAWQADGASLLRDPGSFIREQPLAGDRIDRINAVGVRHGRLELRDVLSLDRGFRIVGGRRPEDGQALLRTACHDPAEAPQRLVLLPE